LSAANAKLAVLDAEEQVYSTPVDGMNSYFQERNMELANMETLQTGAATNMQEPRSVRPKEGVQHLLHQLPYRLPYPKESSNGDQREHWSLRESQDVKGVTQGQEQSLRIS